MNKTVYSNWSSGIVPCSENCGFIGDLDAVSNGSSWHPCPQCGAERKRKVGRFVYEVVPHKWIPFLTTKKFLRVEWRK